MRKKTIRTLLSALLIASLLVIPAYAESATVTGDDVNMRAGPGTGYRIVDCLPGGSVVTVTDRSNSAWYAVTYNGQSGFIAAQFLDVSEAEAPAAGTSDNTGVINAMYVRFRSAPSSDAAVLAEYNTGKAVTITGATAEGWYACTIDGQDGYIYRDYITLGEQSVSTSPSGARSVSSMEASPVTVAVGNDGTAYLVLDGQDVSPANEQPVWVSPETVSPVREQVESPVLPGVLENTVSERGTGSVESNVSSLITGTPTQNTPAATQQTNAGKSGYISGDYVRFRSGPSTSYSILGTYDYGKPLTINGTSGAWTACTIDGKDGYVYSDYVAVSSSGSTSSGTTASSGGSAGDDYVLPANYTSSVQSTRQVQITSNVDINPAKVPHYWPGSTATQVNVDPTAGYINANSVRFRSAPSMSSGILAELSFGNTVTITGTVGEWTAITYKGTAGYVYSTYVTKGQYQSSSVGGTVKGREIADYALQYVGYNYVWGGASPSTGFDCSGLVYYVYKHFGYTLNRVAADQAKNGVHVDASDLQPGDILCFYSGNDYIGHVGIYIGNNRFVHAQNSATGVVTTELAGYYASRGFEARRII